LAAAERDDHRPWVTEDAPNSGQWDEAGEPVDILESLEFSHPLIVTSFRRSGKGVLPEENSGFAEAQEPKVTHTIPRRAVFGFRSARTP
jgi:hypothetical protein